MTTSADTAGAPGRCGTLLDLLRKELAPKPGRLADVTRIVVVTLAVLTVTETFQIPLVAYATYIVFFLSQEEKTSTLMIAVFGIIGHSIALLLAIGIYAVSAGEFALRLPLMGIMAFAGFFLSRISPLGLIGFILGFIATMALTVIDVVPPLSPKPSAEVLTQAVLWWWVAAAIPIALVAITNLLTGTEPTHLFRRTLAQRLKTASELLVEERSMGARSRAGDFLHAGPTDLLRYVKMAGILKRRPPRRNAADQALIVASRKVLTLVHEWVALSVSTPVLSAVAADCSAYLRSLARSAESGRETDQPPAPLNLAAWQENRSAALILDRLITVLVTLPALLADQPESDGSEAETLTSEAVPVGPVPSANSRLFAEDAFRNPEHWQFALKGMIAVLLCYIIYNLLDWPDIRTCVITCFFVSLGLRSAGETFHKMSLRLAGAVIGGGLGLAVIVGLMPYMTDIFDLCLVVGVVAFLAAWIGRSSEWLSYAGLQTAMAFFFAVLVGYGPTTDLALAKDRVVGILLGNLIVWLVFSNIWPVSSLDKARTALAEAIGTLARVIGSPAALDCRPRKNAETSLLAVDEALGQCRRLLSFNPFEPDSIKPNSRQALENVANGTDALIGPTLLLDNAFMSSLDGDDKRLAEAMVGHREVLSAWLGRIAERLGGRSQDAWPEDPPIIAETMIGIGRAAETRADLRLESLAEWHRRLDLRIRDLGEQAKAALVSANTSTRGARSKA